MASKQPHTPEENTLKYLKQRARKSGTFLTRIVDKLEIPRDAVWRWGNVENIAVQRYRMIVDEIEKQERGDR